ncbi:site-2 protease family protein [Oscillatoria sp. CS-180]|uniref:site-2 protease family protein n=1 Tax=Oscillatoria sp. CS-180 TaxID=3021720 RepID=UPI00232AC248|nr:site-2 protease family protein [Oscillatoria sp. CS-180]MDB9529230.1 site-2 protease family protein [Oscillatoria sp. CS-180]
MRSGWRVGSIVGIPLYLDTSWFVIVLLVTFVYGSNPLWQERWGDVSWIIGLAMALLLFGSVLLHELGHSLIAKSQGIEVNSITLFLFGGIAAIDQESKTPGQAFQVAIAGPAVSFGLYLLLTFCVAVLSLPEPVAVLFSNVAQINLVLTLFNLIPGLPLDGGQVLKAAVWKATDSRLKGVRWAARAGQVLGWSAVGIGLLAYLAQPSLDLIWIVLIGGFAIRNASNYGRVADLQETLSELTAADALARDFRVLDANMTLRQFADEYLLQTSRAPMYFAASDGRYRGMVSIDDVREVERSEWESRTLLSIARPLTSITNVRESTSLPEVITFLEKQDLPRVVVLTPTDAVAGVIDRGEIVRALAQKMNLSISDAVIQRIKDEGEYPPGLKLPALAKGLEEKRS